MLGIQQYKKLQELKALGLSKLKVSEKLNLSYKTVWNWWDRDEDFFHAFQKEHEFILENYRQYMLEILKICPQINNTVLLKRIQDDFPEFEIPNATFFRYVKKLREQTGFTKPKRKFQIREQTEPGYEAQVDFGQYVMKSAYKKNIRIYFFCMTLSYSRMKFAYFSVDPFDVRKTIEAHIAGFKYFGGRPQMIVYDQDKTMVVSENLGEVIFVKEFEDFIKETGFTIYLCKGYDPATKGKVEKTVDYMKHQFLDGRIYYGLDRLNQEFIDWLDHDGNGMINETTKKPPRELFKNEYPKLQKYYEKKNDEIVVHTVYHDTVEYRSNLYKLPKGNIDEGDRIRIERYDEQLIFYHATTNILLCKHRFVTGKGNIVTLPIEIKEEPTIEELLHKEYKDSEIAIKFLKRMREQKPRYVYPQCRKIIRIKKFYPKKVIVKGMKYCVSVDTCTVFELCSWLVMAKGDTIAKKFLPTHTTRHYKDREECVKALIKEIDLKNGGTVLVYNDTFEKSRIKEFAEIFPQYKNELLKIHDNIVDLMDAFKRKINNKTQVFFYDNKLQGSYSIKKVLPVFAPELSYKDLEIQEGMMAQEAYYSFPKLDEEDLEEVRKNLEEYCKLDTWSMVLIVHALSKL